MVWNALKCNYSICMQYSKCIITFVKSCSKSILVWWYNSHVTPPHSVDHSAVPAVCRARAVLCAPSVGNLYFSLLVGTMGRNIIRSLTSYLTSSLESRSIHIQPASHVIQRESVGSKVSYERFSPCWIDHPEAVENKSKVRTVPHDLSLLKVTSPSILAGFMTSMG